jgi:hypothetical protein
MIPFDLYNRRALHCNEVQGLFDLRPIRPRDIVAPPRLVITLAVSLGVEPHDELSVLNIKSSNVFQLGAAFGWLRPGWGALVLAVQLVRVVLGCRTP